MPPPSPSSKDNSRSQPDQKNCDYYEDCVSESSRSDKNVKYSLKNETVGLVKSILGPTLEDSVLRTLEFGKSLIQKPGKTDKVLGNKCTAKAIRKEIAAAPQKKSNLEVLLMKNKFTRKKSSVKECPSFCQEKCENTTVFTEYSVKLDQEEVFNEKTKSPFKKPAKVSKIRSLDSDLKQCSPSPEKIKKQLEALIQINKHEPERSWTFVSSSPKVPLEMTVMPSFCMYKNEADMNYSSCCDVQSQASRNEFEIPESRETQRSRSLSRKRFPSKICQAPEFISNALGPTIDVSLIENIKLMRTLLKHENGKGEGPIKEALDMNQQMKQEIRLQSSEVELNCRMQELQKQIEELERREQCLLKQIMEEENMRRVAMEEEERKFCERKAYLESLGEMQETGTKSSKQCNLEANLEALQANITHEENKLANLKCEYDTYKKYVLEAKSTKEALKRNKALLDAWDVFAARVCHTRLPSFSRAFNLERKEFPLSPPANLHCCFPSVLPESTSQESRKCKCGHQSEGSCNECSNRETQQTQAALKCKLKMGEINFPVQRDVICGLHQMLKSCSCYNKSLTKCEKLAYSSEEEKSRGKQGDSCNGRNYSSSLVFEPQSAAEDTSNQITASEKPPSHSKSDSLMKGEKCSKIIKVMWAVTRINIFQNNYRTYEVLEATSTPPSCVPNKTEGIFVVKSQKRSSNCGSRKKRSSNVSTH